MEPKQPWTHVYKELDWPASRVMEPKQPWIHVYKRVCGHMYRHEHRHVHGRVHGRAYEAHGIGWTENHLV